MPYISLENFRYGLDARRSELTSLPGTLLQAQNGHVNTGGEFEKRLAFVNTVAVEDNYVLPTGTFGLEQTDAGMLTFGSIADPGGWPIGAVDGYQQLKHPAVLDGAAYDAQYHAMTQVVWSYAFEGKAFVAAKFADGNTFEYYDGNLVEQSRHGLVLWGWATNDNLAQSLSDTLDGVNGFHTSVSTNTVDVWSDQGVDFIPTVDVRESNSGDVSIIKVSDSTDGTEGVIARGSFQVVAFLTTGSITAITVNSVQINADAIPCTGLTTVTEVAEAIVAEINESATDPRYTATNVNGQVFIYADADAGDGPNGFVVSVTTSKVCIGFAGWTAPTVADGEQCTSVTAGALQILGATITKAGTVASWAAAIAAQIVTWDGSHATGYTAVSSGEVVYISKKVTTSSDTPVTITFTTSTTGGTGNPPSAPLSITVAANTTNIPIDWIDVAGADSYNIYRSDGFNGDYIAIANVAPGSQPFTDAQVAAGTWYFYYMTSVNTSGESVRSNQVAALMPSVADPNNMTVTPTSATPKITIGLGNVNPFVVLRSNVRGSGYQHLANVATQPYDDTAVTTGVPYFYKTTQGANVSGEYGAYLEGAAPQAPFTVKVDRLSVTGQSAAPANNVIIHSDSVHATVSGGVAPFSFAWVEIDNPDGIAPGDPNNSQTGFFANVPKGHAFFATFRCLVTGGAGNQEFGPTVSVSLKHT